MGKSQLPEFLGKVEYVYSTVSGKCQWWKMKWKTVVKCHIAYSNKKAHSVGRGPDEWLKKTKKAIENDSESSLGMCEISTTTNWNWCSISCYFYTMVLVGLEAA